MVLVIALLALAASWSWTSFFILLGVLIPTAVGAAVWWWLRKRSPAAASTAAPPQRPRRPGLASEPASH
jgi:hypothetical protein